MGETDPMKKSEGAVETEHPGVWWMEAKGSGASGRKGWYKMLTESSDRMKTEEVIWI